MHAKNLLKRAKCSGVPVASSNLAIIYGAGRSLVEIIGTRSMEYIILGGAAVFGAFLVLGLIGLILKVILEVVLNWGVWSVFVLYAFAVAVIGSVLHYGWGVDPMLVIIFAAIGFFVSDVPGLFSGESSGRGHEELLLDNFYLPAALHGAISYFGFDASVRYILVATGIGFCVYIWGRIGGHRIGATQRCRGNRSAHRARRMRASRRR